MNRELLTLGDLLFILALMWGSAVAGAVVTFIVWKRVLERTGELKPVPTTQPTGAVPAKASVNTEHTAQRAITEDSIEAGAADIVERAKAQGLHITMKDARTQARQMLSMLDPLGGAR